MMRSQSMEGAAGRILVFCFALTISLTVFGCAKQFSGLSRAYEREKKSIQIGDPEEQVLAKFGRMYRRYRKNYPTRPMERITLEDETTADVFYMRTAHYPDGDITDDELTPYFFVDGKLSCVGWNALGGMKTKHDPEKVAEYRKRDRQMAAALQASNAANNNSSAALNQTIQRNNAMVQDLVNSYHQQDQMRTNDMLMQQMRSNSQSMSVPSYTPSYGTPSYMPGGF